MTMKGGNTAEVYGITKGGSRETREGDKEAGYDNRRSFAESLQTQHPDVVEIAWKWGRWHHNVNYSVFVQKPKLKFGLNAIIVIKQIIIKAYLPKPNDHLKEMEMKLRKRTNALI